ncbi:2-hydroxy-3-oxopropionate reductase [Microbacterium sp. NPDC058342]|uniref:2-hydroxy-3-oxopropionate reductase n=1 Tax=Microbacterium sp. NPDC058342 TaxID=3346454 RepID=UPI0036661BCC
MRQAWLSARSNDHERRGNGHGEISMSRIAFIGLGIMGLPMAANLVAAGHHVTGYNRSPARTAELVARGGTAAESVAEAVADAEFVITMLPDGPDVAAVVEGEDGVLRHLRDGAVIVDMSSISPTTARTLAERAESSGAPMLDAPVSGGERGAIDGTLSIMVGGTEEAFTRALPVLKAMGSTVALVGPAGAGQTVKVANQLIVAGNLQVLAEAMVFLRSRDVPLEAALGVIGGGLAGSRVLDAKTEPMSRGAFDPGFRIELHHKDLGNYLSAARDSGVFTPTGALVSQLFAAAVAQGDGGLDHSGILRLVQRLSPQAVEQD